jgi:hypothetical protein
MRHPRGTEKPGRKGVDPDGRAASFVTYPGSASVPLALRWPLSEGA